MDEKGTLKANEHDKYEKLQARLIEPVHGQ
jgi:hypothetical protein